MRYVEARISQEMRSKAYRIYVTDGLKLISENTAKYAGGSAFKQRYFDLFNKQPEETRTGEEIILEIKGKLRKLG